MEEKNQQKKEKLSKSIIEKAIRSEISKQLVTKTFYISSQFKQHVTTAIVVAFSFLIALIWKDTIVSFIDFYIKDSIKTNIPYAADILVAVIVSLIAVIVSLIAVIGIIVVTNWAKKPIERNNSIG